MLKWTGRDTVPAEPEEKIDSARSVKLELFGPERRMGIQLIE